MRIVRDPAALPALLRSGAVAIGNFDGVHLGHARIIERLLAQARRLAGPALVFTFDPHPVRLLRPSEAPPPLTWTERKAELLALLGIDAMIAYPTDEALLAMSPREFFDAIVRGMLDAKAMVEGPNFYFGKDRQGTIAVLRGFTEAAGIDLEIVEPVQMEGGYVSSSRVRTLIAGGEVEMAARMLTRPYRLRGMVTHGASRGAKIGFPTANLDAIDTVVPAHGVYAGVGIIGERRLPAAVNIGPNPTFGEHAHKVEVHLIDFGEPIYGQPLEVDFLRRLRDVQPFDSVDALVAQLRRDVESTRKIVADHGG